MMSYELSEVFNEAAVPDVTYVAPREERQLKGSLATQGKHVTLVGPSGSGKSTVAFRALRGLDLGPDRVHTFSGRTHSSATTFLEVLSLEFGTEPEVEAAQEWLRLFDIILIDDVHHLQLSARQDLARYLKLWHELGIRFFMIGIAKTGEDILGQDPELAIRNDVWRLGAQSSQFMEELIGLGEKALNIEFTADGKATTIEAAQGSPSICQAICRIACVDSDVIRTKKSSVAVNIDLPLIREMVVRQYDGRYLAKIVSLARGRRQARSVHDTFFRIVEQVARNNREQISKDELYHKIVGSRDASQKSRLRNSFYRAMNILRLIQNACR